MKAVFVRLSVATPYRRSRNPDTSSAPKPRLPPLTSATFLVSGMVVVSSQSTNLRSGICAVLTASSCLIARFLETSSVVILDDYIDDCGHLVALESRLAELADAPFEGVGIFWHQRGDLGRNDFAGDRVGLAAHGDVLDVVELEQNVLDLGRVHFLAAHIYQLRLPAKYADILAVYFDEILGVEPAVRIER